MSLKLTSFLLVLLFLILWSLNSSANKASPLIAVNKNGENGEANFVLNQEAISMIEKLSSPVKVNSAIGDARVGKSTALNFIHYVLSNVGTSAFHTKEVEQIFETGNTMQAVTHGVWISTVQIPGNGGMENVILLDVEGTDLGNDAVTDKLSIFTALTSSSLMLFMKESPSTHILDFLYKIVRLSEVAFGKKETKHFPHLTAVLRGALEKPPKYESIEQYIIDTLISPNWNDGSDDKRKTIGTRFPRKNITVSSLPYDTSIPKLAKNPRRLTGSEYLNSIEKLTEHIFQLPEKRSLNGVALDGQKLAVLVKKIVEVMNNDTLWNELNPDFYKLFEDDLCRKSYEKHIKPLLDIVRNAAQYIEAQKEEKLKLFKAECKLQEWNIKAKLNIENAIKLREHYEEDTWKYYWNTAKRMGEIVVGNIIANGILNLMSDVQLKKNITTLNNSEYETIGLRGVEWVWNQEAERLGMSGKGSGVVAQEVELLYPWAVTEGYDGYKWVNYSALRLLIWVKKFRQKAVGLVNIVTKFGMPDKRPCIKGLHGLLM